MTATRVEVVGNVDAPPEKVYRILADYREHHPRILPKPTFEALDVEEGGVGAGTRIRVTMKVMGTTTTLRMRVDEPHPGEVLREVDEASGAETTFTVTARDGGASARVAIATTWPRRGGVQGFVERIVNPRVARPLYEKELRILNEYAKSVK